MLAQISPIPVLLKDQIELQSIKKDLLSKYEELVNRFDTKYQQKINELLSQKARYQKELHSHFMHQLNGIHRQMHKVESQLLAWKYIKTQQNNPKDLDTASNIRNDDDTKQPETSTGIEPEEEDDDLAPSQQSIIDSNPMDILNGMDAMDIQCDNINVPFTVTPIHHIHQKTNNITANLIHSTPQTRSNTIHASRCTSNNRHSSAPNTATTTAKRSRTSTASTRNTVHQHTLNAIRAIQTKRNDAKNKSTMKEHQHKKKNRIQKKHKHKHSNGLLDTMRKGKKRKNRKRNKKRKFQSMNSCDTDPRPSKQRRIVLKPRRSSLDSFSVENITKRLINPQGKAKKPKLMSASEFRRSSLAFL